MWVLRVLAIITVVVAFILSAGSVQEAFEDNNDKYFLGYALLMISSAGGFIYLLN